MTLIIYTNIAYLYDHNCFESCINSKNHIIHLFGLGAIAFEEAYYGEGSGYIWLDEVSCSGVESNLLSCTHDQLGMHDCDHSEDAGMRCTGTFTLAEVIIILHNNKLPVWGSLNFLHVLENQSKDRMISMACYV